MTASMARTRGTQSRAESTTKFIFAGSIIPARQTIREILDINAGEQNIETLSERLGIPFSKVVLWF